MKKLHPLIEEDARVFRQSQAAQWLEQVGPWEPYKLTKEEKK
jgi:hypothetical protein